MPEITAQPRTIQDIRDHGGKQQTEQADQKEGGKVNPQKIEFRGSLKHIRHPYDMDLTT
ncbi:hypothetical protein [Gimesia sp.]|uniref:hypothetical protein n=1 Tax=Gimesia sp. TaxID=2024833 RepID=UPI0032EFD15C